MLDFRAVTGLPKEWQQTLQANGVTREEQEKNPQAVSRLGACQCRRFIVLIGLVFASRQVLDIMKFYGDNMANGHSIQEGVFDKMKNAAGSNRSSGEAEGEAGQPVSLSQAAEIAKAHGSENAFMAKYAHPVS